MSITPARHADLLRKYNVPGPRYTSYPTVPHWSVSPTPEQWIDLLGASLMQSQERGEGIALYVHIPFCKSLCTYCGCNTRITRRTDVGHPYIQTVLKEWDLIRSRLGVRSLSLAELHLGGGTPTFLSPDELEILFSGLMGDIKPLADAEYSIEADPRTTTPEHLARLQRLGFKRLSFGIQDFDPVVQESVNRVQTIEQVRTLTETARSHGFTSINYDLIYGLPFQTLDSIDGTMRAVRELRPDRIAFYSYAHVPWLKPGQRKFVEADLPSGDAKRALYERGRTLLEEAGYAEIGMDHFALKTDSLWRAVENRTLHRNFMGYLPHHASPLMGLGVSSISDTWTAFAQNEKQLERYEARVAQGEIPLLRGHVLSERDRELRRHILNLMTLFLTEIQTELESDLIPSWRKNLAPLEEDGIVVIADGKIRIPPEARAFVRNVCMAIDPYLERPSGPNQFSKTI